MKKIFGLVAFIVLCLSLHAQEGIRFHLNFNHMALSVKNLQASVDFYRNVFQFPEITNRSAIEGIRWLSLSEEKELHLISVVKDPVVTNKAVHLAFATTQFDAFILHLNKMKIEYYDFSMKPNSINNRADGVKQVYLKDPDGYWIEINNGYVAAAPTTPQKTIVGTWRLVEFANLDSATNQWEYPYGKNPRGYFTYTKNGLFNLNISAENPLKISQDSAKRHHINLYDAVENGALGYFGNYTIDEKNSTVIHHVKGGSIPWYIDTDQPRPFQLTGDTLIIGDNKTWRRVLVRAD